MNDMSARQRQKAKAMWQHAEHMRNRRINERAKQMWDEAERRQEQRLQWRRRHRDRMNDGARRAQQKRANNKNIKRNAKERRTDVRGNDLRDKLKAQCK